MKPNKNSLLLDMDGVVADTMNDVFWALEAFHGISLVHSDIKDYWFNDLDCRDIIFDIMCDEGFYFNLRPITGAVLAVNRLRKLFNNDVFICSSPMKKAASCELEKRAWLKHYFDKEFGEHAIITTDKHSVEGILLLEDNPHVLESGLQKSWDLALFDQAWNKWNHEHLRLYGWHDLDKLVGHMQYLLGHSEWSMWEHNNGFKPTYGLSTEKVV